MLQKGVKFEIEAFSVHTLSFLSDQYIPSKIQEVEVLPGNKIKSWTDEQVDQLAVVSISFP